ncbi:DUF6191 domain-containing protein [Streptomyces sp. NPDC057543]|uniref:DUF6191 domain-containing protein n=1 Tax=Streptomyces sp. NPDC057543 TaxID=3346163 RepID=UPI00369B1E5F
MRAVFNFFEELFAPGRKHAAEEQKRLELTRVDLGVGDPGRGPIDLASGKVIVRAPGDGDGADSDGGAEAGADDAGADGREAAPGPDVPDGPQAGPEEPPKSGPRA